MLTKIKLLKENIQMNKDYIINYPNECWNCNINKINNNHCRIISKKCLWTNHLLTLFIILIFTLNNNKCFALSSSQLGSKSEPLFISRSEAFKFVVGQTIQLPCEVTHPAQYVLAWKRGIAILTAGEVKVTPDPRVRLQHGYTLQINNATPQDAGDYICQIATLEPKEIIHHVEILIPPKIHHVTSGGHLQVKKGSPVRLECSASGNPLPNITWTRKNNILPNGEDSFTAPVYIIENMDRHKGGTYICTANNGVGQTASSQISLHVLYPPEVSVEKSIVYSGEGQEATLVCIVHGESQPEVTWLKDTMQIDTTERHVIENRGARYSLIIRRIYPTDFGNYSCQADNQLGRAKKVINLSGRPNVAIFRSGPISQWKDRYNISWSVNSYAPIEEYRLNYRPLPLPNHQLTNENGFDIHNTIGSSSRNFPPYLKRNPNDEDPFMMDPLTFQGSYQLNGLHWSRYEWRELILPSLTTTSRYTQAMNYIVRGLEPDQQYEAKLQSRNRYGWSEYSEIFHFTTSNTDTEMRDLSVTHYSSTSSSSSLFPWSSSAAPPKLFSLIEIFFIYSILIVSLFL